MQNKATDTSAPPEFTHTDLTFSLPEGMQEWADRNNCQEGLIRLIDVANTLDNPSIVGVLITELAHPESIQILGSWMEEFIDPRIDHLYRVAQSAISDPEIYKYAPKPQREDDPRDQKQFRKKLGILYLPALTAQQYPFTDNPKQQSWYRKIRLWIIMHACLRELDGNTYDKNIQHAATKLRIAGSGNTRAWRAQIFDLEIQVHTFEDMSQALSRKSDYLLSLYNKPSDRDFIKSIKAIAEGDSVALERESSSPHLKLPSRYHSSEIDQTGNRFSGLDDVYPNPLDDLYPGTRQYPDTPESPPSSSTSVNEKDSHIQQILDSKSVFLAYAEDRHCLPWSWQNLSRHETEALENWTQSLIEDQDSTRNLLGAIIWISTRTGRSMRHCLAIQISNESQNEWTLTRDGSSLIRQPPIRQSAWKPTTDAEKSWVILAANNIAIRLPDKVIQILNAAHIDDISNHFIDDLWSSQCQDSAESRMTQLKPTDLKRITPGMLGTPLGQRIFDASGDATYARLISNHPKSGLSAACGYPYWRVSDVEDTLSPDNCPNNETYAEYAELIGAGSRLVPLETLLRTHLNKAHTRLLQSQQSDDLITFHNMVTAYITLAIWAGTATRTIKDPIEDPGHIDLTEKILYVRDKLSGGSRDARLVPLPNHINDVLIVQYQEHLGRLAKALPDTFPTLSREITKLSQGQLSGRIPFLFHLTQLPNDETTLSWISISEHRIQALKIFDCPLPLRLFRHRLAYKLRNGGINPEIIDGFLGHSEYGASSYGDYSTRCWTKDMITLRPVLNAEYNALSFKSLPSGPMPPISGNITREEPLHEMLFGIRARERQRRIHIRNTRESADNTISQFINDKQKQLDELDTSELDDLTYSLLFNKNHLPRQNGFIQYAALTNKINRLWKEQGKHVRISRRYHRNDEDQTMFNPHAIGALSWHRQVIDNIVRPWLNINPSKTPASKALLLATILLCLEGRITDRKLLFFTLKKTNYRLVIFQNKYYLEYSERLDENSSAIPVRRFPISSQAAGLLDRANQSRRKPDLSLNPIPDWLKPLRDGLKRARIETIHDLIDSLCDKMNQVNAMSLPGIVSGYLAGRTLSAGIDWYDWVRLTTGKIITVPFDEQDHDDIGHDKQELDNSINGATTSIGTDDPDNRLKESAHTVFQKVSRILEQNSNISAPNLHRDLSRTLKNILDENNHTISSTIHLLIQWTRALLFRKKKGKQGKKDSRLAISTVKRYLNALSPRFEGLSYDVDLFSLDGDEITDLYLDVLTCRGSENLGYVGNRLIEFHRWAKELGIVDPNWAELPLEAMQWSVRPGYITEQDYQSALRHIVDHYREPNKAAFFLLLCYRFALRSKEAMGLQRRDFIKAGNTWLVSVKKNSYRKLKYNRTSRRLVPLAFTFSDIEKDTTKKMLALYEAQHGNDQIAPIFGDILEKRKLPEYSSLVKFVIQTLKMVTGNPNIVLHHARHSAAIRIGTALYDIHMAPWLDCLSIEEHKKFSKKTQRLLLGRCGVTRRAPWALSVYLGQAAPMTALRNYLHFLPEWCSLFVMHDTCADETLSSAICLDDLPVQTVPALTSRNEVKVSPVTPGTILRVLRLISRGNTLEQTASILDIQAEQLEFLKLILKKISETRFKRRKQEPDTDYAFLTRITEDAWSRLITLCALKDKTKIDNQIEVIHPSVLNDMVGNNRQIIIWKSKHLYLMRSFLDYFRIKNDHIQLIYNEPPDDDFITAAKAAKLKLVSKKEAGGSQSFQVDTILVLSEESPNYPAQRYCLNLARNSDEILRNRLELLLLLISFSVSQNTATT